MGFKENIIMGHIIPAGTGFEWHRGVKKFVETIRPGPLVFDFESTVIPTAAA